MANDEDEVGDEGEDDSLVSLITERLNLVSGLLQIIFGKGGNDE